MLDIQPDFVTVSKENIKENEPNDQSADQPAPVPTVPIAATHNREVAYVDFSSPESVSRFLNWIIDHSGLSKAEIARRLSMERANFRQYYRQMRGRNISMRWIVKLINVTGGRLFMEIPEALPKLRKRRT